MNVENCRTYRDIDEIANENGADDEDTEPETKRARREDTGAEDGNAVPKWSNPDASTVIPPDEPARAKRDMVKLIRQARVDSNNNSATNTAAEDFISFGDSDHEPFPEPLPEPSPAANALGSRKRLANDRLKPAPSAPRQAKGGKKMPVRGDRVEEWEVVEGQDCTPWATVDHSASVVGMR